jgi:hypothetical protein
MSPCGTAPSATAFKFDFEIPVAVVGQSRVSKGLDQKSVQFRPKGRHMLAVKLYAAERGMAVLFLEKKIPKREVGMLQVTVTIKKGRRILVYKVLRPFLKEPVPIGRLRPRRRVKSRTAQTTRCSGAPGGWPEPGAERPPAPRPH